jgi:dihydrofolate synthase/folylpolyglutamate synthase
LALRAAEEIAGQVRPDAVGAALASLSNPGRAQLIEGNPPLIVDAAHNADGARALAAALPELAGGEKVVCCVAILEGKDAESILSELVPHCVMLVATEVSEATIAAGGRPGGRAIPAGELAAKAKELGADAAAEPDPEAALAFARERAVALGVPLLLTGSHFLLGATLARGEPG